MYRKVYISLHLGLIVITGNNPTNELDINLLLSDRVTVHLHQSAISDPRYREFGLYTRASRGLVTQLSLVIRVRYNMRVS